MAYDKVVDSAQLNAALTATANAIREKAGNSDACLWDASTGFASLIAAIQAGGGGAVLWGTFTVSEDTKTVTLDHNFGKIPIFGCWALADIGAQTYEKNDCLFGLAIEEIKTQALGYASSASTTATTSKTASAYFCKNFSMTYTVAGNNYTFVNAKINTIQITTSSSSRFFRAGKTYQYLLMA